MNTSMRGVLNMVGGAAGVWIGFGKGAPRWARLLVGVMGGLAIVQGLGIMNNKA